MCVKGKNAMGLSAEEKQIVEDFFKSNLSGGWEYMESQWIEPTQVGPRDPRSQVVFTVNNKELGKGRKVTYNGKKLLKEAKAHYEGMS